MLSMYFTHYLRTTYALPPEAGGESISAKQPNCQVFRGAGGGIARYQITFFLLSTFHQLPTAFGLHVGAQLHPS